MKRTLFTLTAAVSLVLCLATVGLWVRSHFARSYVRIWGGERSAT